MLVMETLILKHTFWLNCGKSSIPKSGRLSTKLRRPFATSDLQFAVLEPVRQPLQFAIALEESTSDAESPQCCVEADQGGFGHGRQRVAVQRQQCEGRRAIKGFQWQ